MKKLLLTLALLTAGVATAQQDNSTQTNEKAALNPEKIAEMQSKRLTLALDLTDKQQKQVYDLTLQNMQSRKNKPNRKDLKTMTNAQKQDLRLQRMDAMIDHKREMRNILTDDQYDRWEKMTAERVANKKENLKNRRQRRS